MKIRSTPNEGDLGAAFLGTSGDEGDPLLVGHHAREGAPYRDKRAMKIHQRSRSHSDYSVSDPRAASGVGVSKTPTTIRARPRCLSGESIVARARPRGKKKGKAGEAHGRARREHRDEARVEGRPGKQADPRMAVIKPPRRTARLGSEARRLLRPASPAGIYPPPGVRESGRRRTEQECRENRNSPL